MDGAPKMFLRTRRLICFPSIPSHCSAAQPPPDLLGVVHDSTGQRSTLNPQSTSTQRLGQLYYLLFVTRKGEYC